MGKWYTKSDKIYAVSFDNKYSLEYTNDGEMTYCYCKGPDEGNMIGCKNPDGLIEWSHWDCLKIKAAPKGKWYCPDCRKAPAAQQEKEKE